MKKSSVDYTAAQAGYMEHRQLKAGAAGWILLAGLGVSYVISGDFAGWNFGIAEGGWGGLLIATILMGIMYTCMVFGLAEMSSTLPTAGAGYGFARRALGPLGGFATGVAVLIEYAVAPAAISVFIGGYIDALDLFGITDGWWIYLVAYVVFVGVHLWGVGEALKLMFGITLIAVVALIATVVGLIPKFDAANLFNIDPDGSALSSSFLPMGVSGLLAAFVYGIWFFLAVEGVPLAAEETSDPKRDMPRGIIVAMLVLLVFAALILTVVPGAAGAQVMGESTNPLPEAIRVAYGSNSLLADFVNYAGLAGLIASFFSIIYAYSRQLFALSRAGYLPRWLSLTGGRKTPYVALIVPGTIGFLLAAIVRDGDVLINIAVFGATVSYVLLNLSHILLRRKEPDLERGYRTPGGVATTGVALVLSVIAVLATFVVDVRAAGVTAAVFVAFVAYFWFYSRHHLVGSAPEEEFAQITQAESDLR
ncbi:ethanolamine permease [Nocardioides donggukensis]|uniref:Ethanolamine permease n=1 Tax=Nocardioides donggukensis TaxID=2774019 RepID=A0A927K266_9ACTN|nr:ethanolamine permease [Nocardioides donggukensis]MBD8868884.1 ethanolamine permease [Nocardioides donggukensis]